MRRISQSYFDQLVQENAEDFGLSPEEAVQEAIHQLECSGTPYDHLILTAPFTGTAPEERRSGAGEGATVDDSVGQDQERRERADFNNSLDCLRLWTATREEEDADDTASNDDENSSGLASHLANVDACLTKDWNTYSKLWDASGGISIYVGLLQKEVASSSTASGRRCSLASSSTSSRIDRILETLSYVLEAQQGQPSDRLKDMQQCFTGDVMQAWMVRFDALNGLMANDSVPIYLHLLTIAYWSCKRSETQKQRWMEQRVENPSGKSTSLVDTVLGMMLSRIPIETCDESPFVSLLVPVSRWIAVLCRNDFDSCSDDDAPLTASATSRVQQFTSTGVLVPWLHGHLKNDMSLGPDHPERLVALLQTCRALAIHNDVVLTMSQDGLVGTAVDLFEKSSTTTSEVYDASLLAALVGLFRNLCANDDVKNLLGRSVLPSLALRFAHVAQQRPTTAATTEVQIALIEQFCGLIAALSLRHAGNARQLVDRGAVETIVSCMERYPNAASLQRSAAYAVRNLVSRLDPNQPSTDENGCSVPTSKHDLQELCQPALVRAARTHASCQEAVYAALRDLGCNDVKMSRVVVEDNGRAKLVSGTDAFQPGSNAGFRAVYD